MYNYDELLGETGVNNIRQIDFLLNQFGINPKEIEDYIINYNKYGYEMVLTKNTKLGKEIVTTNSKSIFVISHLIFIRDNINEALKEEIQLKLKKN